MTYTKPEVVAVNSTITAIRMGLKDDDTPVDNGQEPFDHTIGAYESDE